ncbi:hypothetical protein [Melittangium boletus]|uniref:Uncharacterized protein n=1 Tax=Melittangium boletus DSM 14713 TaxID=1294270 RepID=A0A250IDG4_9BACT|nr:hypothetical protein [Melittangium boletus]ATB29815.1 hypothetical protein MEBOL_003270 [Melittangium boletus DSM 14713]
MNGKAEPVSRPVDPKKLARKPSARRWGSMWGSPGMTARGSDFLAKSVAEFFKREDTKSP